MPFSFDSPFQTGSSIWSSQSQWIFTAPPYLLYMRLLGPKKRYLRLLYRCRGCYDTKNDTWGCLIAVEAATIQKTIPEAALSLSRLLRHKKRYLRLLYRCGGWYDTKNDTWGCFIAVEATTTQKMMVGNHCTIWYGLEAGQECAEIGRCLFKIFCIQFCTLNEPPITVCWIEVKVAVLCAHQYMPWNLLLIKVLDNFWYFKHQIPTRTCSEAYL